jgi:type IV secretion system protein VirD4
MKNYAGHRLSPWLGHLMVSRQETARPLLTAGEIMQLPTDDELVLVSGCPPIRAKKVRYYKDKRLQQRILPPPLPNNVAVGGNPLPSPAAAPWVGAIIAPSTKARGADPANGGPRREPELPEHEEIAPKAPDPAQEFENADDTDDDGPPAPPDFQQQARNVARQAPLDPSDDLGM